MNVYRGMNGERPGECVVIESEGEERLLPPCNDIINHSPDGFSWGYHGSGPAQLALAILVHQTGDRMVAVEHYQEFKAEVIAALPQNEDWKLYGDQIDNWLQGRQS